MKKPPGRPCILPYEIQMAIGKLASDGEMTFRQLAAKYNVSHGTVNACKKHYLSGTLDKRNFPEDKKIKTSKQVESSLVKENKFLKQEIADLYLQVRMLKKMHHFTQLKGKDDSLTITSENWEAYIGGVE